MKQFFKFVFASCLGVFLFVVVFGIWGIGSAVRMASSGDKAKTIKPNTILELDFSEQVPELTDNTGEQDPFKQESILGLHDWTAAIARAQSDPNIKGILIKPQLSHGMGNATASSVRRALEDFKKSGKFIVAYGDALTEGGYYMASVADKITVSPLGMVEFNGFAADMPFFKDMLDKIGVKTQVYYAGQFKSATEPFRFNAMSPQNKMQVREYLGELYQLFIQDIAKSRNIEVAEVYNIANEMKVRTPADGVKHKLIDAVGYYDEVLADLRKRLSLKEEDKIPTMGLAEYDKSNPASKSGDAKDKIAVVYAEGSIVLGGDGEDGGIEGNRYAKIIRKLRMDKNVRAIVLRVNSGGGSALASDLILRELDMAKKAGKPVIASFGDVAASGGYFIAAHADSIFAEKNTITGSIGVFSMIPSFQRTLNEKLGIHFDTVKTTQYAATMTVMRDFSDAEGKIFQNMTDTIYENFLNLVAAGRKMTREQVHEVAQGRVWTGRKGVEIGLVDKIGNLDAAIAAAAAKAGLSDYRTTEYPKLKEPIEQIMDKLTGKKTNEAKQSLLKSELGGMYPYYEQVRRMQQMQGVQARLPFEISPLN
jgi:protease IV